MNSPATEYRYGVKFRFETTLDLGEHTYHFEFSDDVFEVRLPEEDGEEYTGPTVKNQEPSSIIDKPTEWDEFTTDDLITLDGSGSRDPDGDALNYIWTSDIDGSLGEGEILEVYLTEGEHTITLTVDDGHGGISKTEILIVVIQLRADLEVSLSIDPTEPREGDLVHVLVSVVNIGNGPAFNITIELLLAEEIIATKSYKKFSSGFSSDFETTFVGIPGNNRLNVRIFGETFYEKIINIPARSPPIAYAGLNTTIMVGDERVHSPKLGIFQSISDPFQTRPVFGE